MVHFHVFKLNYKLITIFLLLILIFSCFFIYSAVLAEEKIGIKLPIVMYHSILKDPARSGKYIITPEQLEKDLQYINQKGYTGITISDLVAYVYDDIPLPEKPILISFDDGHYNNLGYAIPLLDKYHMKAVISIVGNYTDSFSKTDEANLNYSYLRWKDILSLINAETSNIEFANHTYNLHSTINGRNGCAKKSSENILTYQKLLSTDLQKLQEEFQKQTNYTPITFTYPFGSISKDSREVIKNLGFKASLSCSSGINYITKDPDCLYELKRNNRPSFISSEQFFKKILE